MVSVAPTHKLINNWIIGSWEEFINLVNTKNNTVRTQIDELKNNQKRLNDRLNNVCVSMNQIIVKQNSFIEELLG